MNRIPLDQFIAEFRRTQRHSWTSSNPAVVCDPGIPDGFVGPDLILPADYMARRAILLEAAGAVGKSTLGLALSAHTGWPLVSTQEAQVGSFSLRGLILDSFGLSSNFLQLMAAGEVGLIIDSLDEAHLKAGTENFLAFLDDINEVASGGTSGQPRVVLLSRPDTATWIKASMDPKTSLSAGTVSMFTRSQAHRFIDSYLDLRAAEPRPGHHGYSIRYSHPTPFARARDDLFNSLESLFSGLGDSMSDILGYVPVLVTLAESLATTNPTSSRKSDLNTHRSHVDLLSDIIERILSRDSVKFRTIVTEKLRALQSVADPDELEESSLYQPREQVYRLASLSRRLPLMASLPETLPRSLRDEYERNVSSFVSDHPFMRPPKFVSVAFSDFVAADIMCDPLSPIYLKSIVPPDSVPIGPFLVWFLSRRAVDGFVAIPSAALEPLLESWTRDAELHSEAYHPRALILQQSSEIIVLLGDERESRPDIAFVMDGSDGLLLSKAYPNLTIIADGFVGLGGDESLSLPDGFHLAAKEIELGASSLVITRGSRVSLTTETLRADRLHQVSVDKRDFMIIAEHTPVRLFEYTRPTTLRDRQRMPYSAHASLRAILMSFRSTVHHGLCQSREQMERSIIKGSQERQRLLDGLRSSGVISLDDGWYTLESSALSRIGLSLSMLKSGELSPEAEYFVRRILQDPVDELGLEIGSSKESE